MAAPEVLEVVLLNVSVTSVETCCWLWSWFERTKYPRDDVCSGGVSSLVPSPLEVKRDSLKKVLCESAEDKAVLGRLVRGYYTTKTS